MAELDRRDNGDLQTGAGAHVHVHGFLRRDGTRVAPPAAHPWRRHRPKSPIRSRHRRHREYIRQLYACVRGRARQQGRHRRNLLPRAPTDGVRTVLRLQPVRGDRHARRSPGDRHRLQQRRHRRLQGGVPVRDRRLAGQTQDHFHVSVMAFISLTQNLGEIRVFYNAFLLEIGHPPPSLPPHPHNANNVGECTFATLICTDPYTPTAHCTTYVALEWPPVCDL